MAVYLGFDLSTQGLTALAIEIAGKERHVVLEVSLDFDEELSHYGTRHGVLPSDDPLVATAPPLMWAEALETMMDRIARGGRVALSDVRAISGSAQQHGSVYLNATAPPALASLDAAASLAVQLSGVFSRAASPIWMDSSTTIECDEITRALGGPEQLAQLTGSRAFERFTGPQIRKFWKRDPTLYASTERIHLVSSFAASLLAGRHAPIDPGDGSGTNLMALAAGRWADPALAATAPGLKAKLPPVAPSWSVVGALASYWQARYGFPPASVVVWSGDNPCALIGAGIVRPGQVAISLGTSDTLFALVDTPRHDPSLTGHVFRAPTGGYMPLICCTNGSLAREAVRDRFGLDWAGFAKAIEQRPAGNGGAILLPWFGPEITPRVMEGGPRNYGLDPADASAYCRALVEAQMLALATHSEWMGGSVQTIHATGGGSANRAILQVMADVFGADVSAVGGRNDAALGAALRAYHADELARGHALSWDEVVSGFVEPSPASTVRPIPAHRAVYRRMRTVYSACEAHALGRGPDPAFLLADFRAEPSARA